MSTLEGWYLNNQNVTTFGTL